jgi:hypothetical protein
MILVPVSDDGWAPAFRCGEFAVVETSDVEPVDGAWSLVRIGSCGDLSIVRLRKWNEEQAATIVEGNGGRSGSYWSMTFGRQRVMTFGAAGENFAHGGFLHMADGPLGDEHMREKIIGRVVGVLGVHDRALNWKGGR